jgi:hypothetical protein
MYSIRWTHLFLNVNKFSNPLAKFNLIQSRYVDEIRQNQEA